MKRTYIAHSLAAAVVLAGTAATAATATGDENVPSFTEFKASSIKDDQGQYIVNGDEPVSEKTLREYYERMISTDDGAKGKDGTSSLVVNTVNGVDDKWSAEDAGKLTYCVSDEFGSDKDKVVAATEEGAGQWEKAASAVNYEYVSSEDGNCNTSNENVVFSVEPTDAGDYIARAFFPSSGKAVRNVLVNSEKLLNSGSWTPANIMAHELGHTLGFRHEHVRPEAGTCFEANNWRPLTPYDSASIMHYPQCNGSSDDLSMTDSDRQGVVSLYGG